jgi:hypothetical protein
MPLVQEPDGIAGENPRSIQKLIQQCSDGSQTRCEDFRSVVAGELLEVHDEAVDRQQTGVLARLDEGQFLTHLRQNPGRAVPAEGIWLRRYHWELLVGLVCRMRIG